MTAFKACIECRSSVTAYPGQPLRLMVTFPEPGDWYLHVSLDGRELIDDVVTVERAGETKVFTITAPEQPGRYKLDVHAEKLPPEEAERRKGKKIPWWLIALAIGAGGALAAGAWLAGRGRG